MRYSPEVIYIQTMSSEEIPLLSSGIIANILIAMQINFVKKKNIWSIWFRGSFIRLTQFALSPFLKISAQHQVG